MIEPYQGYATVDDLVLLGRVHSQIDRIAPKPGQDRLANLRQMVSMFRTEEVGGATVRAKDHQATADDEGYFELRIPRGTESGWQQISVTLDTNGSVAECPVLVPSARAGSMVISDIDDTIMQTGAHSLARNLWTTFSGNALSRQVFPDAAVLLTALSDDGRRPVFYVSSSPWNLYYFLNDVFERASVVPGPMFLRDLGLSETKLVTDGHGAHKGASIDTILDANPGRTAVLMGDTGQKDAQIYRDVIARHAGRIRAVVLRTPGPGIDDNDKTAIRDLESTGVLTLHGRTFSGMAETILTALADPAVR